MPSVAFIMYVFALPKVAHDEIAFKSAGKNVASAPPGSPQQTVLEKYSHPVASPYIGSQLHGVCENEVFCSRVVEGFNVGNA